MILSVALILVAGYVAGRLAGRGGLPPLLGMILIGIAIGPQGLNALDGSVLEAAPDLRTIAVAIILMKAGLGLDRRKLAKQGTVALRLGFLPALCEAISVTLLAPWLLGLSWSSSLILGCILGAESPAVIVPGMLRLKQLGWGVEKGIADAILSGSAVSDVVVLTLFSVVLAVATGSDVSLGAIPVQVVLQIGSGLLLGLALGRLVALGQGLAPFALSVGTVALALALVALPQFLPWLSGYLAVMMLGFVAADQAPLAGRLLRQSFAVLWTVAELFLFVLLGAAIVLTDLGNALLPGLLLLVLTTVVGRGIGWYLATLGSDWTPKERLFLLAGNSAKATVQAAIGAVPLSAGVAGGEVILAIAVLSILVTAPLGAWAIPTFAPKLLERGTVDPTQVERVSRQHLVAIWDGEAAVLKHVASQARLSNAQVIILGDRDLDAAPLADIDYRHLPELPLSLETVLQWQPDTVVIRRSHAWATELVASSAVAVTLV